MAQSVIDDENGALQRSASRSASDETVQRLRVARPQHVQQRFQSSRIGRQLIERIDLVGVAAGPPIPGVAEQPDRSQLAVHLDLIIGVRNDEGLHRTEVSPTAGGTGPRRICAGSPTPRRTMAA